MSKVQIVYWRPPWMRMSMQWGFSVIRIPSSGWVGDSQCVIYKSMTRMLSPLYSKCTSGTNQTKVGCDILCGYLSLLSTYPRPAFLWVRQSWQIYAETLNLHKSRTCLLSPGLQETVAWETVANIYIQVQSMKAMLGTECSQTISLQFPFMTFTLSLKCSHATRQYFCSLTMLSWMLPVLYIVVGGLLSQK